MHPIKFTVLKVKNISGRIRRLSATGYVEWVLGDLRSKAAMQVITEIDPKTGAIFARNPYNTEFAERTAFFDAGEATRTVTGDRTEFLGRNGTLQNPAAMTRARLSGRIGASLDPCAAIQVPFDLADGQEREIIFRLGVGRDSDEAGNLVRRFRGSVARVGRLKRSGSTGITPSARCRWKRRINPSTCWPTAGSYTRLWHAVFGHGADTTNPGVLSVSATNCRT